MSLTTTQRAPGPATGESTGEPAQQYDDWAICCSGGGIRSATYCLGGLQTLEEGGLLGQAKWIIGISGGSYIAASRALVAYGLRRAEEKRQAKDTRQAKDKRPAYARGTPEEDNLRNNTHYIAPDTKTVFVAVLSMLLGAAVIAILALAPVFALSHAWGWLLHSQGVLTWSGGKATASISAWTWWLAPVIAAAITLVLFGYWWFTLVSGSPERGAQRARLVGWFGTIAASLAVLMLAVPLIIQWLYSSTGALGTVVRYFGFGGSGHWSWPTFSGLIAAVVALARSSQKQLAKVSGPTATTSPPTGFTGQLATLIRGKLAPWVATILIVGAGAFITVLWISTAARVGFSAGQLVQVVVAVVIVAATRALVDINRTSLHYIYRWRLADAYAVTRDAAHEKNPDKRQLAFAEAARTRLSDLRGQDQPKLVIATTANINADRTVPPGRGGFCLAFDPDKVTLHGDPSSDEPNVEVNTTDYEHLLGRTSFTLFDVVAISGAAFSPLMGSATRHASRLMLTLANLRLGVWMPHPTVVRKARAYLEQKERDSQKPHQQPEKSHQGNGQQEKGQQEILEDSRWTQNTWLLLFWYVLPNLSWGHDSTKQGPAQREAQQKKRDLSEQREAQLWAHVLKLRSKHDASVGDRLKAAVCWRLMQPTLGLLWAEAVGHTSYRATWVNVTDGGHYDNLGLVEALRRRAENIVVLDASGDNPHTWYTLGGAMALARADAEVDITLDPSAMIRGKGRSVAPGLTKTQVVRPWARGTFARQPREAEPGRQAPDGDQAANGTLPDGRALADDPQTGNGQVTDGLQATDDDQGATGNLWVCKLGWWDGAPWDVRAYAAGHSTYPCDPTTQQLYDGAEFDAYHELGACSVMASATDRDGDLPLR